MKGTRVAIVGGGPVGLAAALFAKRAGMTPIVIEARDYDVGAVCLGSGPVAGGRAVVEWLKTSGRAAIVACAALAAGLSRGPLARMAEEALGAPPPVSNDTAGIWRRMQPRWQRYRGGSPWPSSVPLHQYRPSCGATSSPPQRTATGKRGRDGNADGAAARQKGA